MNKSKSILIISGFNTRAIISFCRWAKLYNIDYNIIASDPEDKILLTNFSRKVIFTRKSKILTLDDLNTWIEIIRYKNKKKRILILPSTEYLNRFLLKNKTSIESNNCIVPLVDDSLYEKISNKYSFAKLCESYNLTIPCEFPELPKIIPFVAKPRVYMSDKGQQLIPHLITSKKELDKFTQEENPNEYFFQHLIHGQSIYLLAYIGKNGTNVLSSQENLMQQARGGSIILAKASNFHQSSIASQYISMLNDLNFTGPIMIELRLDKISGQCFMIEANPRLWGPMQFTVDNNVDIFGSMLREFNYNIPINSNKISESSHYFWSGGISPDSEPIIFHNYSSEMFIKDFSRLRKQDIYLKKDTIKLYINEI